MHPNLKFCASLALAALSGGFLHAEAAYRLAPPYPIGGIGSYDYVRFDSATRRLFVSHQTRVEVLDADTGKVLGAITGLHGVHGIALAHDLGRGFISNGQNGTVTVFDLATLAVTGSLTTGGQKPDAIEYDPATHILVVSNGHSKNESLIEAATGKVTHLVALAGNPESIVFDGQGRALVNEESHNSVARIDLATGQVLADWSIAPGDGPTGLAIDLQSRRAFVSCGGNEKLVVIDADDGHTLAVLPIGDDSDGAAFDPGLRRVYSSNRDGTLTAIQEDDAAHFRVLANVTTEAGAKTLAVDPISHRVFLPVAKRAAGADADHPGPVVPGTFQVLVVAANGPALDVKSPPTRSPDAPLLVWDLDPGLLAKGYRNFRTSNDPLPAKDGAVLPDATGLAALHESGSSEFTTAGLRKMLGHFSGPVTIFDLRAEDHGFINGEPVSWFATNNWANVGKDRGAIIAEERSRVADVALGSTVTVSADSAKKSEEAGAAPTRTETAGSAQTEAEVAQAAGADYVRIPVNDHTRPSDEEVDRFVAAVRAMPADGWAHFHCRAGRGRTTTFMAMYDMLRNASRVSLPAIVDRQSLLAVDYDLLNKEKEPGAKAGVVADRADFVRAFYAYAKANPDGGPQTWTQWLAANP